MINFSSFDTHEKKAKTLIALSLVFIYPRLTGNPTQKYHGRNTKENSSKIIIEN